MAETSDIIVDISEILMDGENPRHEIINDQRSILNWHVHMLGNQLINLMSSIAKNGLSDIDRILLLPTDQKLFIVKEGNRRIAALKLLRDPSLCDDAVFRRRIENIQQPIDFDYKIKCVSCEDRYRILWMMGLKHLGQQNGVGTFTWGASEKSRHEQDYSGKSRYWRSFHIIEYAIEKKLISDQQAVRLHEKISNLDRLVASKEFRHVLGLTYKNEAINTSIEKDLYDEILGAILEKLSAPSFIVSKIYDSDQKIDFISNILDNLPTRNGATKDKKSPIPNEIAENNSEGEKISLGATKSEKNQNRRAISKTDNSQKPKPCRKRQAFCWLN